MVLPLLPQSSLSLHLHRAAQARLPLTFRITFPSPPRPSRSPEVTTPDSRSDGLNYYLFLFGFTTTTRRYKKSQGRQPRLQMSNRLRYLPTKHTRAASGMSTVGSRQGRRRAQLSGQRGPLTFNPTSATEGASWLVVLGRISIRKLKPPRVNGPERFLAKGLFIPQEENIGNSHCKDFSTMEKN